MVNLVELVWDVNFHTHAQRQIARINLDGADQRADMNFKQWLHMVESNDVSKLLFMPVFLRFSLSCVCVCLFICCVAKLDELHEKHFPKKICSFLTRPPVSCAFLCFTNIHTHFNNSAQQTSPTNRQTETHRSQSIPNSIFHLQCGWFTIFFTHKHTRS